MERLRREARRMASESLGLVGYQAELDVITTQEEGLEKRERATWRAILARIRGVEIETIEERSYVGPHDHEVDSAITRRPFVHEVVMVLAADKVGREILKTAD
jgi:hypothetical protein